MGKKFDFQTSRPSGGATVPADADKFIKGHREVRPTLPPHPSRAKKKPVPDEEGKVRRLSFDISASLHRKIRVACVDRDSTMTEEITKLLNKEFGG
ncbi:MAG: hypothetical protein Q8O64_05710 [Sideroxyarcus sp.]|nr:hypothetical protein [Sideroxyarcus sp.]